MSSYALQHSDSTFQSGNDDICAISTVSQVAGENGYMSADGGRVTLDNFESPVLPIGEWHKTLIDRLSDQTYDLSYIPSGSSALKWNGEAVCSTASTPCTA